MKAHKCHSNKLHIFTLAFFHRFAAYRLSKVIQMNKAHIRTITEWPKTCSLSIRPAFVRCSN